MLCWVAGRQLLTTLQDAAHAGLSQQQVKLTQSHTLQQLLRQLT